jgi:hypothetical protein
MSQESDRLNMPRKNRPELKILYMNQESKRVPRNTFGIRITARTNITKKLSRGHLDYMLQYYAAYRLRILVAYQINAYIVKNASTVTPGTHFQIEIWNLLVFSFQRM